MTGCLGYGIGFSGRLGTDLCLDGICFGIWYMLIVFASNGYILKVLFVIG